LILNLKEKKDLTEDKIESLKAQVESYTNSRDDIVAKKHNITPLFLESWIQKFKNDR